MPFKTPTNFGYRQIHLDFHTSEHIEGVGADFDPVQFVDSLKSAHVDSVTLFGRCHHGWCYYPTTIGQPHPHLERPDLLGDMVSACREAGIHTPIYMTVQWDELTARQHPEWRVMRPDNRAPNYPGSEHSAMNQLTATWHTLCLNHPAYIDHLIAMTLEVCELYEPPALFMDIVGAHGCVCQACLTRMKSEGLDAANSADRKTNDKAVLMAFFERFTSSVTKAHPDVRVFYNAGHVFKGQTERYNHFGQLELESLPTGGWGYDHFPASARYADGLGLPVLGMTGRFHTHWGEFGGYKQSDALIFECCQMIAMGAHCSIGDQLHPRGKMEQATYDLIAPAYARVKALEPFAHDAVYQSEVALFSLEAQDAALSGHLAHRTAESDTGAARMLLEMQIPFDVIENDADLSRYKVVILPDDIRLDQTTAARLAEFTNNGGAVILTGRSGLNDSADMMMLDTGAEVANGIIDIDPSYLRMTADLDADLPDASIVMYEPPVHLKPRDGTVLGSVRPSYFNRSWDRFCSHLHTPEDTTAVDVAPAIVQKGRIIHCAYPLFRLYGTTGQVLYKYLVRGMLTKLQPDPLITTTLPSAGRASLMAQPDQNRITLHLLYAPTQLRGSGMAYNDGHTRAIEIIEDAPELHDVECTIRVPSAPSSVCCAYTGEALPWEYDDTAGKLWLRIPKLHIHGAAVISFCDSTEEIQ